MNALNLLPLAATTVTAALLATDLATSPAPVSPTDAPPVVHYGTETIDGLDVFFREAGDPSAPQLVLLHGFPTSSHMFRDVIPDLARDFPDTLIILNHTGLPSDRSAEGLAGWRAGMETLAAQPNTAVKISGIGLPGIQWTAENNAEVVLETIRIFGAERCMFASNFPVDSLAGSFDEIYGGYKTIVADLPEDQIRALFHDNAQRIYRPV